MTAYGASRPLPRVATTVCFLITERELSLGGGNASSCPKAVSDGGKIEEACGRKMRRCDAEIDPFAPDPAHQPRPAIKATTRLRGTGSRTRRLPTAPRDLRSTGAPICPAKTTRKGRSARNSHWSGCRLCAESARPQTSSAPHRGSAASKRKSACGRRDRRKGREVKKRAPRAFRAP